MVDLEACRRIYLPKAVDVAGVNAALAGARRRLAGASCQALHTQRIGNRSPGGGAGEH